jgi:hypothetical protein
MNGIIEDDAIVETPIGEIIPPESKAAELFVPNGLDKIIAHVRKVVEQFQPDMSTEKGRKACASLGRWVSTQKSTVEGYGVNFSRAIKVQAVGIDSERKRGKEAFEAMRDQVLQPLEEYKAGVKARTDNYEQALLDVADLSNVPFGASVAEIEKRIAALDDFALQPWEEFAGRFSLANDAVSMRLTNILALTKKQEEDQAALAKLEAERVARESQEAKERQAKDQAERDERIAREATERAEAAAKEREAASLREKEAAEAAAKEREAASLREKEAAEARAAKAEQDAKDAAGRATAAEQKRAADAKAAEDAATKAREQNKAHSLKRDNETLAAICALGLLDADARKVLNAIVKGEIPNVKMVY